MICPNCNICFRRNLQNILEICGMCWSFVGRLLEPLVWGTSWAKSVMCTGVALPLGSVTRLPIGVNKAGKSRKFMAPAFDHGFLCGKSSNSVCRPGCQVWWPDLFYGSPGAWLSWRKPLFLSRSRHRAICHTRCSCRGRRTLQLSSCKVNMTMENEPFIVL